MRYLKATKCESRLPAKFRIRECTSDAWHILGLAGELDIVSAPSLDAILAKLSAEGARHIVLDLKELEFLDSTGIRTILTGQLLCKRSGCELSLLPGPENIQRTLELTGLTKILPFQDAALMPVNSASTVRTDGSHIPPDGAGGPGLPEGSREPA